ncbi:MAG TPA: serine/threonine-protein kinase [Gemmatales bacterium]|nr:serine/threonine-protein kinase [Gemmatales bacterium]
MNTPAENLIPQLTPITHDTVGRTATAELTSTLPQHVLHLDYLFPEKFGQYRVLKLICNGGMGSVYLAEDSMLKRKVAIKTLKPELAMHTVSKERFLREAIIVSGIKHEQIVTIYGVGEDHGVPWLAMEYLEGHSLEEIIQRKHKFTWVQIMRLGREIARALAVAHSHGLVHRDIKPANIWLETIDKKTGKTRIKLLDFGLARYCHQEGGPTQAGMVVGTPHYVSPEQARGRELDSRSDLFSLGVVLYRLSTRVFPFDGADTLALLTSLAVDPPKSMREHNPEIPQGFDQLVMKLLEKQPEDRIPTARQAAEQLQVLYHAEMERTGETSQSGKMPALKSNVPFLVEPEPAAIETSRPQLSSRSLILLLLAFSLGAGAVGVMLTYLFQWYVR